MWCCNPSPPPVSRAFLMLQNESLHLGGNPRCPSPAINRHSARCFYDSVQLVSCVRGAACRLSFRHFSLNIMSSRLSLWEPPSLKLILCLFKLKSILPAFLHCRSPSRKWKYEDTITGQPVTAQKRDTDWLSPGCKTLFYGAFGNITKSLGSPTWSPKAPWEKMWFTQEMGLLVLQSVGKGRVKQCSASNQRELPATLALLAHHSAWPIVFLPLDPKPETTCCSLIGT